ncbi:MAG: hypothetical protein OEM52_00920 [bacterium]|nr:hypothetical protein [bacterium]
MSLRIFIILLVVCALTLTAFATATTHIWGPSTDVQGFKVMHITSDMYLPTQLDAPNNTAGTRLPPITNLGLTMGVLPFEKMQMEVGFDHKSGFGNVDKYPMYFNAKIGIPEKAFHQFSPAIAVGMFDLGTKADVTDYNTGYGKLAWTLASAGRISVGYFSGNEKLLLDSKGEKDNAGVMAAWERTVFEKGWVCVEYMGTKSAYGTLNLGFAWKFADNVSVLVGYDIMNDKDLAGVEDCITIQTDIDFPIMSPSK